MARKIFKNCYEQRIYSSKKGLDFDLQVIEKDEMHVSSRIIDFKKAIHTWLFSLEINMLPPWILSEIDLKHLWQNLSCLASGLHKLLSDEWIYLFFMTPNNTKIRLDVKFILSNLQIEY